MMCNISLAEKQLMQMEDIKWKAQILQKPKLRLYRKIKTEKKTEQFLKINMTRQERAFLAQL